MATASEQQQKMPQLPKLQVQQQPPLLLPLVTVDDVLAGLGAPKHLDRERALRRFQELATDPQRAADLPRLAAGVRELLASGDAWERRLGGLMAARVLVEALPSSPPPGGAPSDSGAAPPPPLAGFDDEMVAEAMRLLEDDEVRVRLAVGQLLRALAAKHGPGVLQRCQARVLASIHEHFDREGEGSRAGEGGGDDYSAFGSGAATPGSPASSSSGGARPGSPGGATLLSALLAHSYQPLVPGVGQLRHGTEGWKCLETSMKALQQLLEGTGPSAAPLLETPEVQELLYRSMHHPNRFVRETAHFTAASLCEALAGPRLAALGAALSARLADGLSDSWSQVRYAACVATRAFMASVGATPDARAPFLPALTGPMCLNRYYVAEGVRLYAQETWRQVMGDGGRAAVARHIDSVVSYYVSQAKASNHAVREAACAVIAELMAKVDRHAVAPRVPDLLRALLLCFKDASWPVRDAACNACGRCVVAYPEEAREVLDSLYALWFDHLWDNIPTVREDTACALADAVRAYGQEAVERIVPELRKLLPQAHSQPPESQRYSDLDTKTPATFGVAARRARDNDPAVHTDQDMFSCGSLATRFSTERLVRSDGCNDYGFARAKEPWEGSDGAVHMVRELAAVAPAQAAEFVPPLADLARLATFQHAFTLHETVWRSLPAIARALGVKEFKAKYLELFLPPLFADLRCGHQLAEAAAGRCLSQLRDLVGARIFAGRLDEQQRAAMAADPNILPPAAAAGAEGAAAAGLAGGGGPPVAAAAAAAAARAGVSTAAVGQGRMRQAW